MDECHRTPSTTFTEAVQAFDCAYMLGLSATPYRNDGLTKLIYFHVGDRVQEISTKELQQMQHIMTATLKIRETDFVYCFNDDYAMMLDKLVRDYSRNELVVKDIANQIKSNKGIALVISERRNHCTTLYDMLNGRDIETRLLTGDVANGERKTIVEELNQGKVKALVATSQLIGEGFDLKHLSSIFLVTPIRYHGRLTQYIGRILRTADGKDRAFIFDYNDMHVGVLKSAFKSRCNAYRKLGIKIPEKSKILNQ